MEIKTDDYRVWSDAATIHYEGTMRLSGTEAYAPILEMMDKVLAAKPKTIRREEPKVQRNDPCPCGSGKKYKNCHGRR